ncbi:MAG: hypothetical protein ABIE22_03120 [archaeon]
MGIPRNHPDYNRIIAECGFPEGIRESSDMTWAELQLEMSGLMGTPHRKKLHQIVADPITSESIRGLVDTNWYVFLTGGSHCLPKHSLILLREIKNPYESDKELCHEVAHAIYDFLPDQGLTPITITNNRIAEWVGRQIRADYRILREIKRGFELPCTIYDRASELAFGNGDYKFARTLMD